MTIRSTPSSRLVGLQCSRFPPSSRSSRSGHPDGQSLSVREIAVYDAADVRMRGALPGTVRIAPDLAPVGPPSWTAPFTDRARRVAFGQVIRGTWSSNARPGYRRVNDEPRCLHSRSKDIQSTEPGREHFSSKRMSPNGARRHDDCSAIIWIWRASQSAAWTMP